MRIAVLGTGSWGTALSLLLGRMGHEVQIFGRDAEEVSHLRDHRENLRFLPGFVLPEGVTAGFLTEVEGEYDLVVVAVPSHAVREVMAAIPPRAGHVVVASKGLETSTGKLMTEVAAECWPHVKVSALSGPNLAVEIARGVPTVAIAANVERNFARVVQDAFTSHTFRVSISDDVAGVELGGALKNVLAIGAGVAEGLGFGDNTKGAFLSRGLMEMATLGQQLGARLETFLGPAGVGDLFATASSKLSRNFRLGFDLGQGFTVREAADRLGQVAEGVLTSEAVGRLARQHGLVLPVFTAVDSIIQGRITPQRAVAMLMEKEVRLADFQEEETD
ncbi:MAG: NAD(P)-dependent glycerol-3-phosphate dehydrogenase [Armatimonadetes bacterium]|nr:NAD(P)-dependent glycerol-3-phosphate dehydrogenase [Armatimonadota bacterium]